jgi:hypothetical protein
MIWIYLEECLRKTILYFSDTTAVSFDLHFFFLS